MIKRIVALGLALVAGMAWSGSDTGVRVNGLVLGPTTSAKGTSPWSYSSRVLKLTGEGSDYEIWGTNTTGDVRIEVACNCKVAIRSLNLDVSGRNEAGAIFVKQGCRLELDCKGASEFQGGPRGCGIQVPYGATVDISSSDGSGFLSCYGGKYAAGIGEGYTTPDSDSIAVIGGTCGTVLIRSGVVLAQGGYGGAGIGGGGDRRGEQPFSVGGNCGTVRIYGGLVSAYGGTGAAGIGGGAGDNYSELEGSDLVFKGGDGGAVMISGGSVIADGGAGAACIGGGVNGHGGSLTVSGGCLRFSSRAARDVGAGKWIWSLELAKEGSYSITGGSVVERNQGLAPVNAKGARVYSVEVPYGKDWASPKLTNLMVDGSSYSYGMNNTTTLDIGGYRTWWPKGDAVFNLDGEWYQVKVRASDNIAEKLTTTFNGLGGTVTYGGQSGSMVTLATYAPNGQYRNLPTGVNVTRSGYAFTGWLDGTGKRVHDSDYVPTSSRTLMARWSYVMDLAGAFDASGKSFEVRRYPGSYASCSWFGQSEVSVKGGSALRSGTIGNNQTNVLRHTVTGPGVVSFKYRVSSETNYDKFTFATSAQATPLLVTSGTNQTTWATASFTLGAGSQTLSWTYAKDGSRALGEDCVWLDDFQWKPTAASYSLKFDANGGTGSRTVTVTYGKTSYNDVSWIKPTKEGYVFAGWWTAKDGGKMVYDADGHCVTCYCWSAAKTWCYNGNAAVYAHWTEVPAAATYTLKFDACGGTGSRTVTVTYGKTSYCDVSWIKPTKEGYVFAGWWTAKDGGKMVYDADGKCVTCYCWNAQKQWCYKGNASVYAHWTAESPSPTPYSLRIDANGGTGSRTVTVTYGKTSYSDLSWIKPTKAGYAFAGWWSAKEGGKQIYGTDGKCVTCYCWNASKQWCYKGNAAVYAHWTPLAKMSACVRAERPLGAVVASGKSAPASAPLQFVGVLADETACVVLIEPEANGFFRIVVVTAEASTCHTACAIDREGDNLIIYTEEDTIVIMAIEQIGAWE